MKLHKFILFLSLLMPLVAWAQKPQRLSLPRQEQLSSQRVSHVIQDSEGFLWYATEGGGVCRDNGRQITIFRSDAEHPDLLGSNDVACLAEAADRYIIIGTFHGANVLDKHDYNIRRLEEVDDKRVDDIIVGRNGHWWLTANKKVFEYAADGQLLNVYPGGDKYIFRLHQDSLGRICGTEWEGGQLCLEGGRFVQVAEAWPEGFNFNRMMTDRQGRQLVTDMFGNSYALSSNELRPFFSGQILNRAMADSVLTARGLSTRPTAFDEKPDGELWFSTGKDIRVMKQGVEQVVLPDTKDVSAMTFTNDGTLWLATIFGTVMTYKDSQLAKDDYASNEYGDAIAAMEADSSGCLVIVYDRYVRIYNPMHRTLRQQNVEDINTYRVELQETQPSKRWSQPEEMVVERLPPWLTSWWMWCVYALIIVAIAVLMAYNAMLRRQRDRFLEMMKRVAPQQLAPVAKNREQHQEEPDVSATNILLEKAIALVEKNLSNDQYTIEALSSDLCMSRMTLYRKIQAATGQKPTEFMRTIRLHRAADLLQEGNLTVSEISYATGFSSVSYFSRCFRAMYGVPPTQLTKTSSSPLRVSASMKDER